MPQRAQLAALSSDRQFFYHFFLSFTVMVGLVMSLSLTAQAAEEPVSFGANIESFTLENGMQVVVIPDNRTPVVTHMVWYKVGAADEPEGVSGIAHFLEHLMFKGTEKFPGSTFSDTIARLGGTENAFTSQDYTAYFQRVAKEHLPTMMEMEADRMSNLILTDPVVLPERDVVKEERSSRTDNDPSARLSEKMARVVSPVHPYGIPIIGWPEEIAKLSKEDAISFYNRFYTPSNAILIVAGDVTPEEVKTLAETYYGPIAQRAEVGPRVRPQNPKRTAPEVVELASPQVGLENIRWSFQTPSYATGKKGEGAVLDVVSQVLGGGVTSHLYQDLVVKQQIASSAGSYYQGSSLDPSQLMIYATPANGITLEELQKAVEKSVTDFVAAGANPQDVKRAKTSLVAEAIYAQDNQSTLARIYGVALTTGQSIEDVSAWVGEVEAVTPEMVQEAAKTYLDFNASVVGFLRKEEPKKDDAS